MAHKEKTELQKRTTVDLIIILIVTFVVLGVYMGFQNQFVAFTGNTRIHILLRVAVMALMQFGVAGLGITIVCIIRGESFKSHGLQGKGAVLSIVFSALAFVPYTLFSFATGQINGYLPFKSVWMTREVLASGFPVNAMGMALITAAWGFFEGFNYVVISNKINKALPSAKKWLNWGAVICGIMCLVIHGMIGVTPTAILHAVSVFVIIYGMLLAKDFTGSAWGCVFVFIFLWNAY